MFKKILLTISILGLSLISFKSYAATQGTIGATSQGSKAISITIAKRVQITNIADAAFGTWSSGDGTQEDHDNICIYSNAGTGQYNVTADSTDGSGTFTLDSGGTNLAYGVAWSQTSGVTTYSSATQVLTENTITTNDFTGASTTSATCGGGDTATLSLQITSANLEAVTGTATPFTDTLTITVTPI